MDATELIRLLNTDHYSPANLEEVNDLCRNYPMFNLAHALKVRIGTALGHPVDEALRLAAIYAVDRSRLYELVNEVNPATQVVAEVGDHADAEGIQFSEESTEQADVIIVQHAPYAAPDPDDQLLELDEEEPREAPADMQREEVADEYEDGEGDEEGEPLSSEDLVGVIVKDETDMEEPMPEGSDIPVIDVVEPESGEAEQEVREASAETQQEDARQAPESESQRLIEQFIRGEPGPIRADRVTSLRGDVSVASIREHDGFITDTLARIYVKQGLYAKAIYAYEKLSLKYPEKSAYFAAQIEKIKNITQS